MFIPNIKKKTNYNLINENYKNVRKSIFLMFLHIYCSICPGSGSGFLSLHTDTNPTFIIRIQIHGSRTGSASLPVIKMNF